MFKFKKIVLFAIVPLVLAFAGVIIGSMPGVDSEKEDFDLTPAPASSAAPTPTRTSSIVKGISSGPQLTFAATGHPYNALLVLS